MSLQQIGTQFSRGGSGLTDGSLANAIKELQGLSVTVVAGASAGTAMAVPALRKEDTLLAALVSVDAGGAMANDVANLTVQATAAFGTITISGNPADAEVFTVNGKVYTFKTTPADAAHVKITLGDVTAMATAAAAAINAYEPRNLTAVGNTGKNLAAVVATSSAGVVTVTSVVDGLGNGVVLTGTATVLAATGSGTASATLTPVTVVADNTCVISGVTFTAKVAPAGELQFPTKATAVTDLATGIALAKLINDYEAAHYTLDVVATAHATTGVVTLVPRTPNAGNIITLTKTATNVAVTGSGTLTGGTNTGGVKSTTDLTAKTLTLIWFNKK